MWDRYDYDGDGNFNEPDGYIDHFQIVHAGGDQADGDPMPGRGRHLEPPLVRPSRTHGRAARPATRDGGTQIGNTGIWIGDYTIQPENGGRSVFFHEYGHDLGLPDDYNILSGGDNNNEHWTLMAQSRLGAKNEPCIGDRAGDLGAWNKLQLGWLDYETVVAGRRRRQPHADARPAGVQHRGSRRPSSWCCRRRRSSPTSVRRPPAPTSGTAATATTSSNTMTRQVTLPAERGRR